MLLAQRASRVLRVSSWEMRQLLHQDIVSKRSELNAKEMKLNISEESVDYFAYFKQEAFKIQQILNLVRLEK